MTEQTNTLKTKVGKCLLGNWVEERAVAALDEESSKLSKQKSGHKGIITTNQEVKMETVTTSKASHVAPKNPGVRLKGMRRELLEKYITQKTMEKVHAELNPPPPAVEFCSTTQKDFCVQGFIPRRPQTTKVCDYKTEAAITFWSENCQKIQGVTPIQSSNAPFRKSTLFSTPISERLDEIDLPPDN